MNRSTHIRSGVATGIAGAGLALGGIGIAWAADDGTPNDSSTPGASSSTATGSLERNGHGPGHGPGRGHGLGGSELAEALGVSEDDLRSALESVREQLAPSRTDRSDATADGDLDERRDQMIDVLAEELGLSAAEVTAAFEQVQQSHADERRTALEDRLDEAVTGGDLTAEDRASVLKAFDAGVFGGRFEAGHGAR